VVLAARAAETGRTTPRTPPSQPPRIHPQPPQDPL